MYSRTLDDVGHQFPEIVEAAQNMKTALIADGEIVAFKDDRVLPFALLQKRLGRKQMPAGAAGRDHEDPAQNSLPPRRRRVKASIIPMPSAKASIDEPP